jgi:hypothetical protein
MTTFSQISNFSSLDVAQTLRSNTRIETVLISLLCVSETKALFVYSGIRLSLNWSFRLNQSTNPLFVISSETTLKLLSLDVFVFMGTIGTSLCVYGNNRHFYTALLCEN